MPTDLSRCHGGIVRDATCVRIDLAHGRASWYVRSDIGAIDPGRWQAWHFSWKMGATSLAKVGFSGPAAAAGRGAAASTARASVAKLTLWSNLIVALPFELARS